MKHWIRDALISANTSGSYQRGYGRCMWVWYHFLRLAGWTNIWEIDGYSNHVPDGSCEDTGTTSWTVIGSAVLAKDTTTKHMGYRSLKITSNALNDGVQSDEFTDMETSLSRDYTLRLRVWNNTGRTWELQTKSGTSASWVTKENIASVASWQEVDVDFVSSASETAGFYFRIRDDNYSGVPGDIYIDSIFAYYSLFEDGDVYIPGTNDGSITNPDQFSSSSYTFVAGDVGKFIAVYDTTNVGNSGVYEITAFAAGGITLGLRAGGSPALATQSGLPWRMLDVPNSFDVYTACPQRNRWAGYGLESPHAEKWRIFFRANTNSTGNNYNLWINLWASAYDADFDVDEGDFYNYESSSRNYFDVDYTKLNNNSKYCIGGKDYDSSTCTKQRLHLMMDGDHSNLHIALRDFDGAATNSVGGGWVGFTGSDTYHTLRESFMFQFPTDYGGFDDYDFRLEARTWGDDGCQCVDYGPGWMVRNTIMVLGFGSAALDELDETHRANPFDGKYWLRKPKAARDFTGSATINPTEKVVNGNGVWHGAPVTDWSTIDSNSYFHIRQGWFWEWHTGHEPLA